MPHYLVFFLSTPGNTVWFLKTGITIEIGIWCLHALTQKKDISKKLIISKILNYSIILELLILCEIIDPVWWIKTFNSCSMKQRLGCFFSPSRLRLSALYTIKQTKKQQLLTHDKGDPPAHCWLSFLPTMASSCPFTVDFQLAHCHTVWTQRGTWLPFSFNAERINNVILQKS